MDRREQFPDPEEALRTALAGLQSKVWTALPAILKSYDPALGTAVVVAAVQGIVTDKTGARAAVDLPPLHDVPVIFPQGGGFVLTFPLADGDEGLVVFASRCIDPWWYYGEVLTPTTLRMHSLADGFFLPGVRSKPRAISGVSTNSAQLRNDAGDTYVEVDASGNVKVKATNLVNVDAPAGCNIDSPVVAVSQNLTVGNGASGTFTTSSGAVVTVQDGIVTNII